MGKSGFLPSESFVRHRFFGGLKYLGKVQLEGTSVELSQDRWVLGLNIVEGLYQEMVITLINVSIRCASKRALFRSICWLQTVAYSALNWPWEVEVKKQVSFITKNMELGVRSGFTNKFQQELAVWLGNSIHSESLCSYP